MGKRGLVFDLTQKRPKCKVATCYPCAEILILNIKMNMVE